MLGISIWISFENIKSLLVFFFLFLFIQSYIYWAWTFLLRGGLLRNIVNCKSRMNGGNGERDGVVSSAVKYHVLLSRLVLANVLGKFKPSVSCFLALMLASLLAHLLISARRPSVFECFCFGFFFSPKGVDVLISLWITIVVIGYHVHGYCCHDSFLISHTSFLIFWLCFLQTSVPCCVSFSFFLLLIVLLSLCPGVIEES